MFTKQEAIERIKSGLLRLPPLIIKLRENKLALSGRVNVIDTILDISWQDEMYGFGAEYKSRSTPKEFQTALDQTLRVSRVTGLPPMILMPFLNEHQLLELADRQISGLDFSGNGVVIIPKQMFVFRSGSPNQFPASESIQNIYRKNSSVVSRAFLSRPVFNSVNSIQEFIQMRGGDVSAISLSTVSKALKVLENDLVIGRGKGSIHLLQPKKLLEKLVINFTRPLIRRCIVGKSPYDAESLTRILLENSVRHQVSLVGTGVSSTAQYAVMARENFLSVYCTDQYRLLTGIEFNVTAQFPNLEIIETYDKTVYFDSQTEKGFMWASPIQTYLELMAGDQRERETANQVREVILQNLKAMQQ